MSLDKNDKLSLGIFGLGAVVAYILAFAANKKSSALAEEGGSPPPFVPKDMRVVRIQRKVGDAPGGYVEYTEKLKYILSEGEATPAKIRQLQKTLGHPNPSGYIDAWTQRVFGQIYTTWEVASGPNKGQKVDGPSLLDMIRTRTKAPLGKGTFDPYTGGGRSGVVGLGVEAPYAALGERTAARSGKGVELVVPEGMKAPLSPLVEREIEKLAPDLVDVFGEGPSPLRMGEKTDSDLAELVRLKKQGKTTLPAGKRESASQLPKERAQAMRESTVGFFATLPKDEREAMIKSGLVDKMGTPTERGVLEVESIEGIHPLLSGVASVRRAAVKDIQRKLGMPETGESPLDEAEKIRYQRLRQQALEQLGVLEMSPAEIKSMDPQKKRLAEAIAQEISATKVRKSAKTAPSSVGFSGRGETFKLAPEAPFVAPALPPSSPAAEDPVQRGAVVTHPEFGEGIVTSFREGGKLVVVEFPGVSSFTSSTGGGTRVVPRTSLGFKEIEESEELVYGPKRRSAFTFMGERRPKGSK